MVLEVTVLSAEALTINRRCISAKTSSFAAVHPDSVQSAAVTNPDHVGGSNPVWNQKITVDMPRRSLTVEVRCSGNKHIGAAVIPVSDFTGGYLPVDYLHFLSYRLRDQKGTPSGIINISVRAVLPPGGMSSSRPWMQRPSGVPVSSAYY